MWLDGRTTGLGRGRGGLKRNQLEQERGTVAVLLEQAGLSRRGQHRLDGLSRADQPDAIAVRHRLIQGAALHIGLEKVGEPGLWQVHLFEEQWLLANAAGPLGKYDPITRLELQRPGHG